MSSAPQTASQPAGTEPHHAHLKRHHSIRYRTMKLIRRTHTYTGLFMTPVLLVYGISGFLFNHPRSFPAEGGPAVDRLMAREVYEGSRLAAIPPPEELAAQVVQAYNARAGETEKITGTPANAHYANYFMLNGEGASGRYNLQIDLNSRQGIFHNFVQGHSVMETTQKNLGKVDAVTLDQAWQKGLQEDLRRLTAASDNPLRTAGPGPMLPELAFNAEAGGKSVALRYRLGNATLVANDMPWKQKLIFFFRRMHLAAGYQPFSWLRTAWAIQADAICVLMCAWALSGIIIWWQMRNLRKWGLITLGLMLAYFVAVGVGMYRLLL